MDNISHSVAGLIAGELIHRSLPEETNTNRDRLRQRLLLISGWSASNFPDLDLVLSPLLPSPLGYLLHHRGHTHTLLYALPQALLLLGMIWGLWPAARTLLRSSAPTRTGLMLSIAAGLGLHLLMDYLNSYGLHPFHPIDSRWFYGDMVFIIEPLFWVALGIPMAVMIRRRSLQILLGAVLLGIPLFFTMKGFLTWVSYLALVAIAAGLGWAQRKAGPRDTGALVAAAVIAVVFVGIQSFASGQAKRIVIEDLKRKDSSSRFLDSAMSSFPTNPLCWIFVSIESNEATRTYRLRRGLLSLAPGILPASDCPAGLAAREEKREITPAIVYYSETTSDLDRLRQLKNGNCHFEAWLRFARAPLLTDTTASDLRFAPAGPRGDFSTITFKDFENRECPRFVPGWDHPRADLLGELTSELNGSDRTAASSAGTAAAAPPVDGGPGRSRAERAWRE